MERILSSLEKKKKYEKQALDYFNQIYQKRDEIRRNLPIKEIKFLNDDSSFIGVDTSFEILKNYLSRVEYVCIGIATWFNSMESHLDSEYGHEDRALYEVETEEYDLLIKGLAISMEIEMVERLSKKFKYAFMDRSFISMMVGLNQALRVAKKTNSESILAQKLLEKSQDILTKLQKMLNRSGLIFSVKRSSREELKNEVQNFFPDIALNDYELAYITLNQGEYIELPIDPSILKRNYLSLELIDSFLDDVSEIISGGETIYLKGINNRIFKFEVFKEKFPAELAYTQTCTTSNELLIIQECDRIAKNYLQLFREKSLVGGYR